MKRIILPCVAIAVFIGTVPLLESASEDPKRGGTLVMSIRKDVSMVNPLVRTQSTDRAIRDLMYESLLGMDTKGTIQPYLAESWEISKDGKVYTFRLRRGVRFHDGQEMTSEDAKFAIDYTLNPKNGAYGLSRLADIGKAEAADKYTLKIHLKRPNPIFLTYLTEISGFSVLPKESLKEGIAKLEKFPPGTGPFRFVDWKTGQQIVFDRFDGYWGKKAFVDKVILRPIPDSTVRFTALRSGDVDLIERSPYEWVKQIGEGKIEKIGFVAVPYAGFRRLYFNMADPPFDNKKLRQAVSHAINKKEILSAAYFGFGEPTDQKYPKGHHWYFEGVATPAYDLNKAKALLKESGYGGETIPIMARQGEDQETEGAVLQAQLKKIGITVKVEVMEVGAYNSRQRRGEFAFMFYGGGFDPDPSQAFGPELTCEDPRKRSSNMAAYCDKEIQALLKKAELEMDQAERRGLFKRILTKMNDDLPYIPIGYAPRFFTLRNYVKGFTTDNDGNFRPWGGGLNYTWLDK